MPSGIEILMRKWILRRSQTANAQGGPVSGGSTPQLSAPASLTPTVISATEIDLAWSSVTSATNYILQRGLQSDYSDAVQIYSGALTSFNNTGLTGGTTYYYRVKVQAAGFTDSDWTNANAATNASFTTSNLVFTDRVNMSNTAQELTATSGTFAAQAVDALFLGAGVNGRIYSNWSTLANNNAVLGFNDAQTKVGFASFKFGADLGGDGQYYEAPLITATGYSPTLPIKFGLFRCGASFKPQVSTDGVTWTDLHIFRGNFFGYNSSAAVYPVLNIFQAGNGLCSQPKIDVYGAGNVAKLYINTGNSIAAGFLTVNDSQSNIGQQGWLALDGASDWFYGNKSLDGQDINAAITAFPSVVAPLMVAGFSKIVVSYLEGTNALVSFSAADAFSQLQTFIDLVLNQISTAKIMVYMTPTADPAHGFTNAKRLAFNSLIAGLTQTSRLKIVDLTGTPELNDANAYLNGTYYQADGVHLTQAGYDLLASVGNPVLLTF